MTSSDETNGESVRFLMGEVATRSGVSRQVLHRYIDIGLINEVARNESGYRLFDERVFEILDLIQQLKKRYTLRDIREIFFRRKRT